VECQSDYETFDHLIECPALESKWKQCINATIDDSIDFINSITIVENPTKSTNSSSVFNFHNYMYNTLILSEFSNTAKKDLLKGLPSDLFISSITNIFSFDFQHSYVAVVSIFQFLQDHFYEYIWLPQCDKIKKIEQEKESPNSLLKLHLFHASFMKQLTALRLKIRHMITYTDVFSTV
jgi:hypothetical protein